MKSIREWVLKNSICFLVLILPIINFSNYFFPYVSSKTFVFYGFMSILLPVWIYTIYIDKSYLLSRKQIMLFVPLFLYVGWLTISGILAVNPHLSFWSTFERGTGLITIYSSLIFAIITSSIIKHDGVSYINKLLKYVLIASLIVALSVWFGNEGFNLPLLILESSGGGGLLGNSSITATYLLFSLFLGFYLLFSKNISKKWKFFISIILVIIMFSPLFINIQNLFINKSILGSARGALLGIFIGFGFAFIVYFVLSNNKIIKYISIISIFISLLIFSIGWSKLIQPDNYLHNKFTQVASGTRFIFWDVAQKAMNEHPYFGYGPENYYIAFQNNFNSDMLKDEYGHETGTDKAHNIYFDIGVAGGYPALILYGAFILIVLYVIYFIHKNEKISRLQAAILFGLIVGYIFQNLFVFDSNISILYIFLVVGLAYGLVDEEKIINRIKKKKVNISNDGVSDTIIGIVLFALSIASLSHFTISPAKKSILFEDILKTYPSENKIVYYKDIQKGSSIGIDRDLSGLADSIFKVYMANLQKLKENKASLIVLEKDIESFLACLEASADTNQTDFRLQISIVRFYSIYYYLTDKEVSLETSNHILEVLDKAHELSPTNPEVYWWKAQIYAWQTKLDFVIGSYKKAIEINPTLANSHNMLINFAKDIGDDKLYEDALNQAKKDIPGFKLEVKLE